MFITERSKDARLISVRAAECVRPARRATPPLAAALPLMPAERRAVEHFARLESETDHDAYLAACKAACRAGPAEFNTLCDVALRRLPLRTPRDPELLQAATHELVVYFAALDRTGIAA